ncbi:SH3 domain-containing protein [Roseibium aggregatum]|uniref:Bacterial SH3 domain protein n=1 Tax=Roseibium aggregatum TaxID=187304 RepID=A0A0M6YBY5_9HYPH|nr:SH3 domain-containing protein [Roseibium aggregatum]CTQ47602.1 Bacterial SH3 domain protein [Roseibium aggregatum]
MMPLFWRFVATTVIVVFPLLAVADDLDVVIYEQGGDGQIAECWLGAVSGLKKGGDGFLAVRSGPGTTYRKMDELYNGDHVLVYDGSADGKWLGVIYGRGQEVVDNSNYGCGYVGQGQRPLPYPGKKGWIHSNWVIGIAG